MNKRQFSKVVSLYQDGASIAACMTSIINICRTETDAGVWCAKLHNKIMERVTEELRLTACELTEANNTIKTLEGDLELGRQINELTNRSESANMEDQRPD